MIVDQDALFLEREEPAEQSARRALDELFDHARQYRTSEAFRELLEFTARFRLYSPYNAMLLHIQRPGATFVANPRRWLHKYGRRVRPGASPLVILQPMGPVMFVFDVTDTIPQEGAPPLPEEVTQPFEVRGGSAGSALGSTIENAKRDGVEVHEQQAGSQSAGMIRAARGVRRSQQVLSKRGPPQVFQPIPVRFDLFVNSGHSAEGQYATLAHELGHLYCGHLGTPDPRWWPDRQGMSRAVEEFEAESVCWLVCERLGIDNPSERYLSSYLEAQSEVPPISLEAVLRSVRVIEEMGRGWMPPRKSGRARPSTPPDDLTTERQ